MWAVWGDPVVPQISLFQANSKVWNLGNTGTSVKMRKLYNSCDTLLDPA